MPHLEKLAAMGGSTIIDLRYKHLVLMDKVLFLFPIAYITLHSLSVTNTQGREKNETEDLGVMFGVASYGVQHKSGWNGCRLAAAKRGQ